LFYGQERVALPGLTIPHPRAGQRDFVVSGMEELAPGFLAKMLR
jgi:7,8-dihydro-6-hydroxymethylpterin-pyrophosphokinase